MSENDHLYQISPRVIFQNMSSYVCAVTGNFVCKSALFFGLLLPSVLSHYQEEIQEQSAG